MSNGNEAGANRSNSMSRRFDGPRPTRGRDCGEAGVIPDRFGGGAMFIGSVRVGERWPEPVTGFSGALCAAISPIVVTVVLSGGWCPLRYSRKAVPVAASRRL